jgi:dihydroorotate dehydrogenase
MSLYSAIRPLLFRLDAERAHRLVFGALSLAELAMEHLPLRKVPAAPELAQDLFGITFPNPVGLAAGLDKNAELPHLWPALGFGFAELGTVTARAQSGNPRPRLFRLPDEHALINRMGFNNRGAEHVAQRLRRRFAYHRCGVPLGLNIGKSRVVPIEEAASDHAESLRLLFPLADYIVLNVSSPNTPGLRDLQSEALLEPLLSSLQSENQRLAEAYGRAPLPVLVKVSPDLTDDGLQAIVEVAQRCRVSGLVATNTTVQRPLRSPDAGTAQESGGLSGAPLLPLSTHAIRVLHQATGGTLPIIGAGGIFRAEDAYEKIRAGASLVQVYTALVYEGPSLPQSLCAGLLSLVRRDGFTHLRQAVGCAV